MHNNLDPNTPKIARISDNVQSALMWLFIVVGVIGVMYFLACIGSTLWISVQGAITQEDIKNSSWLSSPTTVLHFSGFMGSALSVAAVLIGSAIAVVRKSLIPLVTSVVFCSLLQSAFSSQLVYSSGIYNGTIKVGCYVWESKDCQELLGYPKEKGTFSKYNKDNTAEITPEYLTAFESLPGKPSSSVIAVSSMPGAYFLMSPFTAYHFKEIEHKLQEQRKVFEKNKNSDKAKTAGSS